jgi:hypothetical protein
MAKGSETSIGQKQARITIKYRKGSNQIDNGC